MDPARIAQLLDPFLDDASPLPAAALHQISMYIDLLLLWNARVNLTAVRTPEEIVTRHFGESLFAARQLLAGPAPSSELLPSSPASLVVDLGSGAGVPGLPLKIWSPDTKVTLIESNHKKVAFLREAIRALTLTNIDVFPGRAQDFPPASARTGPPSPPPPAPARPPMEKPYPHPPLRIPSAPHQHPEPSVITSGKS